MAADHCTNPSEYTIDKRCYVTDEQKKEKPYNAVVALVDGNYVYCTGTIVKHGDKPWLYTAKHCTADENDSVRSKLEIKLQDGSELKVTENNTGNYNIKYDVFTKGDWAIYQLGISNVPSVEITDKKSIGFGPFTYDYDARVVGYGVLKIMSDTEISEFRDRYIKYLKDKKNVEAQGKEKRYGFKSGGIDTTNYYVINFILSEDSLGSDQALKVSNCKYSSNGKYTNCQSWGGNSGGPIFDDKNAIMGIHTRGNGIIGGSHHASSEDDWFAPYTNNIPLLKNKRKIKKE